MQHLDVPVAQQGLFSGLAIPVILDHLTSLGITAIEFLPVQAFLDESHLLKQGFTNYWGDNTVGFVAPEPRYLSEGGVLDFQTMVRRLHDAGIEVILDVVYNHTAEGSQLGPTLSFRSIDNASYYRFNPENRRYYVNAAGCGNALNMTHPRVLQAVMDRLRYWVEVMRVDGFRFDLASLLGRESYDFDPHDRFFDAIRQDPALARTKLIVEPWDIGPDGYQLGGFRSGLAEWNDRYRDDHDANRSWNHGAEGPTDDPEIQQLRARQQRNMQATLLLLQGTPMLLADGELSNTQDGNNITYCQDNEFGSLPGRRMIQMSHRPAFGRW